MKPITVAELIAYLQQQPQDYFVAHDMHSEQCLLDLTKIRHSYLGVPRNDGWVPDVRQNDGRMYVVFPGN